MSLTETEVAEPLHRPALAVELTDRLRRMIMEDELKAGREGSREGADGALRRFPHAGARGVEGAGARRLRDAGAEPRCDRLGPDRGGAGRAVSAGRGARGASPASLRPSGPPTRRSRRSASARGGCGEAYKRRDRPAYFEINQSIHAAILEAAANPTLSRHHASIARRVYRARYQANLTPERWLAATREHEAIQAALEARDGPLLGTLMKEHLQHKLLALTHDGHAR